MGKITRSWVLLVILCSLLSLTLLSSCKQKSLDSGGSGQYQPVLKIISGNGQWLNGADTLVNRLVVEYRDANNQPVERKNIVWTLTAGNGQVFAKPVAGDGTFEVIMMTNALGQSKINFESFGNAQGSQIKVAAKVQEKPELAVQFIVYGGIQPGS